jgi:hypothetical protein
MTNYLLDTNILLRSRDIASPDYNLVDRTIRYLISNNHRCFITSQVLIEFWVVATRPVAVNGFGWTPDETERTLQMGVDIAKTLLAKYCLTLKSDKNQSIWQFGEIVTSCSSFGSNQKLSTRCFIS